MKQKILRLLQVGLVTLDWQASATEIELFTRQDD